MTSAKWCPRGEHGIKEARIRNSLVAMLLAAMVSLPVPMLFLVFNLDMQPNNAGAVQSALEWASRMLLVSLGVHWAGILLALGRARKRLRPLPTTRVGPAILVGTPTMVRFRERCLDLRRSDRKASPGRFGGAEAAGVRVPVWTRPW